MGTGRSLDQAARGASDVDSELSESVSPEAIALGVVSAYDCLNVPAVLAVQSETCVMVSEEPAQLVHCAGDDSALVPPDADPIVAEGRVVTEDTFAVPAAPGSPVCSWMNVEPMSVSSRELACEVAMPTVTCIPPCG